MKEINGCETDSTLGERWIIGEYKLKRCPLKELTNTSDEYFEAYKFFKNGILPMQGGWLDQAKPFLDAMKLIDSELQKVENQIKKEQRR